MVEYLLTCIGFAIILIVAASITAFYCSLKIYLKKDSFKIKGVKGVKTYY